jgi:hypothetical protein
MESTNPSILKFAMSKLSFWVQNDKKEQITLDFEKKINCKLGKAKQIDKLYISIEIKANSVPAGTFKFSANCKAIVAAKTQGVSDDDLKEQIARVYVPLVDQMVVEKIKNITIEMGHPPLDLSTDEEGIEVE